MRLLGLISGMLVLNVTFLGGTSRLLVTAAPNCPLDLSWSNYNLAASVCSDSNQRGICCRHISAFVAVSVARYANLTGKLGVPTAFSQMCLNYISDTLSSHGIPAYATIFCGLGAKILVTYECKEITTVLEMLQSPHFDDVVNNCNMQLSSDNRCKRCLNSAILYLHRLIEVDDNVTLSVCRDATFVSLINQGDQVLAAEKASCFFGVEPDILSGSPLLPTFHSSPSTPVSSDSSEPFTQTTSVMPVEKHHHGYQVTAIQGVGIGVTGLAILLLMLLIPLIRKKTRELKNATTSVNSWKSLPPSSHKSGEDIPPSMFRRFSYKDTEKATNGFSSVIAKGGFGTVFKAQFSDGTLAAVKRLDKVSEQGEDDFCREIELLGRLHHRHLVSLRGFCIEKRERFLVYEYMENGSVKDHLHFPGRTPLSWKIRLQIAIDVANALEYLHFFCNPPLCHRDVKSSNILLDENFVAKLADFGLAHASRSGSVTFEPVNTDIRGTPGYMDPEYFVTQELTAKSDIYSYGVLLLELVTGRCAIQNNKNLVEWAEVFMVSDARYHDMVDPWIADSIDLEQLKVMIEIIQWCTLREGRARPAIKQVVRMLHERLAKTYSHLPEATGANDRSNRGTLRINKEQPNEGNPYNGDTRCLMSSSSTSKSYCSQSFLLESASTHSPHVNYS